MDNLANYTMRSTHQDNTTVAIELCWKSNKRRTSRIWSRKEHSRPAVYNKTNHEKLYRSRQTFYFNFIDYKQAFRIIIIQSNRLWLRLVHRWGSSRVTMSPGQPLWCSLFCNLGGNRCLRRHHVENKSSPIELTVHRLFSISAEITVIVGGSSKRGIIIGVVLGVIAVIAIIGGIVYFVAM